MGSEMCIRDSFYRYLQNVPSRGRYFHKGVWAIHHARRGETHILSGEAFTNGLVVGGFEGNFDGFGGEGADAGNDHAAAFENEALQEGGIYPGNDAEDGKEAEDGGHDGVVA